MGSCAVLAPPFDTLLAPLAALVDSLDARRDIPQIEFARGDDAALLLFRHMHATGRGRSRAPRGSFSDRHAIA
ncbi:hypothetical protein B2A_15717, partial [mine drainage metagenome]